MKYFYYSILIVVLLSFHSLSSQNSNSQTLPAKYIQIAEKIRLAANADSSSWERLAYLCDMFGNRLSGSESLEKALNWVKSEMEKDGFTNVKKEPVKVPHWVRGNEYLMLTSPRKDKLPMVGLGGSIATPPGGIEADVIVVKDFDDLYAKRDQVKGKIVLYNAPFVSYGKTVQYRFSGAVEAARYGAVASLIRSVSPAVTRNVHTGVMGYNDSIPKIPHAAISAEDAMMLERMQNRGVTPRVKLYMEAKFLDSAQSYNVMGEIKGSQKPDEIIALGGHMDSWDIGYGAQDDGSGVVACWEALKLLKKLGLTPKRTIRVVGWTNEENGSCGGKDYAIDHENEKHVLVFEMDGGSFKPGAIRVTAPDSIYNAFVQYKPLFDKVEGTKIEQSGGGTDIGPMMRLGTPGMSLSTDDGNMYFRFHHSWSDTPDKVDPKDLNDDVAAIALAVFLYADLDLNLPSNIKEK